ncbi:hypothetical protein ACJX0J_014228, partial [Zea mays]
YGDLCYLRLLFFMTGHVSGRLDPILSAMEQHSGWFGDFGSNWFGPLFISNPVIYKNNKTKLSSEKSGNFTSSIKKGHRRERVPLRTPVYNETGVLTLLLQFSQLQKEKTFPGWAFLLIAGLVEINYALSLSDGKYSLDIRA